MYQRNASMFDRVHVQVSLNASGTDAVLLIERYYATPSSNRNDAMKYVLIGNRYVLYNVFSIVIECQWYRCSSIY